MALVMRRLICAQIPEITLLGIGSESEMEYLTHARQLIGMLLGATHRRKANSAMHAFLQNTNIEQGGDLVSEFCKGPLMAKIYTHNLGTGSVKSSYFVTTRGVQAILRAFANPVHEEKLASLLLQPEILAAQCEVVSETPIDSGALNKKRRITASSEEGVYVLRFSDGVKPLFYVGKSSDIEKRIQQHASGQGAACVTGRDFTRVPCLVPETTDIESWERGEVLERMYQFGIDAVRGWKYTLRIMPLAQKLSAFDDVCERFDLCRRCGRGSHFVRECETLTTDRWTNGLEVRSFYQNMSLGEEELNRLESQVQQERTARMEAERKNADAVRILLADRTVSMEPV